MKFGRGLAACQQMFSRTASAALGAGLALAGYPAAPTRQRVARQDLVKRRLASDAEITKTLPVRLGQALERTKVKHDQYVAGETKAPPVFNVLIISGGGDWGAFGAGYLKGWQRIPAVHHGGSGAGAGAINAAGICRREYDIMNAIELAQRLERCVRTGIALLGMGSFSLDTSAAHRRSARRAAGASGREAAPRRRHSAS